MKFLIPAFLLLALPAAADTVRLKNGSTLEGKVIVDGDSVVVEMDFGRVTVKKTDIAKITYDVSPLQELEKKLAETKSDDAEALYKLGVWARERELEVNAKELFGKVVAINTDHDGARTALGFRKHEGRWLVEADWYAAQGMVKYRGAWMKREEIEKLELAKDESERRNRTDNKLVDAQAELLRAQADLAKAQAEAERTRAEIEKQIAQPAIRYVYVPVQQGALHTHTVYGYTYSCCCQKTAVKPAPKCEPPKK